MSRANQVDALLLENKLEEDLWRLQVLQEWAWNPTRYTGLSGGSLYSLLARDYAPLEERLVHVSARLEQFPRLFEEIRATLVPERVPQIHAETAVSQNRGALSILDNQVVPHLDVLADDERARLEKAMDTGRAAVEEHQRWLEEELLPAARGEFRIGLDLFDAKLGFTLQSKMDRPEIRRRAEERLALVRSRMYELAQEILSEEDPTATFPETPSEEVQQETIQAALDVVYGFDRSVAVLWTRPRDRWRRRHSSLPRTASSPCPRIRWRSSSCRSFAGVSPWRIAILPDLSTRDR